MSSRFPIRISRTSSSTAGAADSPLFDELKILPGGRLLEGDDHKKVLAGQRAGRRFGRQSRRQNPALWRGRRSRRHLRQQSRFTKAARSSRSLSDMQQFMNRPASGDRLHRPLEYPQGRHARTSGGPWTSFASRSRRSTGNRRGCRPTSSSTTSARSSSAAPWPGPRRRSPC